MNKPTYKIHSLGCKVNQYDSKKLEEKLIQVGFCLKDKNTDLIIVNTCSVTKTAITKSRQALNRLKRENPKAKVVLMGCFPKVYEKEIDIKKLGIDILWKVGDTEDLISEINKLKIVSKFKIQNSKFQVNSCTKHNFNKNDLKIRSRYFLKVQDGCEQFCAYCIIPYARGKLTSRLSKDIIKEAKEKVNIGYREIVLSGIHLGLYGINNVDKNKEEDINLVGLLKKLVKIKIKLGTTNADHANEVLEIEKIRLSSIEITEVTDELIDFMNKNKKMCAHLHISLQSGCDKTLKDMNRPYTTKYFENRVKKLRKAISDIAISTDVIVGFPGETKKDFKETKKFIETINFSRLHVFSFSAHEKTPAFDMPNQVDRKEIKNRSEILRHLSKKLEKDYKDKFKGKELEVVVEAIMGDVIKVKSQYFFDILVKKENIISEIKKIDKKLIGKVIKVIL